MHDDRCPNCDRVIATADNADEGMCEVELSYNSRRRSSDWNLRARRACDDHAVDWRTRALAAEAALVELTERAVSRAAIPPIDAVAEKMVDDLVAANRPAPGKRTATAKAAPDVCLAPWEAEDLLKRIGNTYDLETTAGRNRADAAMRRALDLLGVSAPAAPATVARPISEWHEDRGSALWWRFPVEEPPYSGSPLDSDWPGYHTHWTPIVCPDEPHDQADADPETRGPIGGGK